jgi:hypothetical protein
MVDYIVHILFFLSFSSHPPPFLLICIYISVTVFGQKSGQKSGHWPEKVGVLLYFSVDVRKSPKMTGQKPTFAKKSGH